MAAPEMSFNAIVGSVGAPSDASASVATSATSSPVTRFAGQSAPDGRAEDRP